MSEQSTFQLFSRGDEEKRVILELKPYIQPFEKILANAELAGLIEPNKIKNPFDDQAKNQITISTQASLELLQRRLTYWQRVGTDVLRPTLQVLQEASLDWPLENLLERKKSEKLKRLPVRRRLRYGPHDIHEYRGKFFPQLVKSLINSAGVPEGGIVIDPMCGSGTTPCEARAMGMESIALDLNPLSVRIAKTKTEILEMDYIELQNEIKNIIKAVETINEKSENELEKRWNQKDLDYLKKWFAHSALCEINNILEKISECEHPIVKDLAEISLSNVLRPVSWQKDVDLRVRKDVRDYIQGTVLNEFVDEMNCHLKKIVPYLSLREDIIRLPSYHIKDGDTREIDKLFYKWENDCDVLITSPPYAMALPYLDTDRLSLIVLGLLPRKNHRLKELLMIGTREITEAKRKELWENYQERKKELPEQVSMLIDKLAKIYHGGTVGFRRKNLPSLLAKYYLDMMDSMKSAQGMMKPNSFAFYVVGNNSTKLNGERIEIPTDEFLWLIGKKVGWKQHNLINMELLTSRDIFRKNRGTAETILIFKS